MNRHIAILTLVLTGAASMYAGSVQLQIGGTAGLASTYTANGSSITQTVTGGATGAVGEKAYVGNIPPGSTSLTGTSGVPTAPGVPNGEVVGGQSLTSNGVTFDMIDDGVSTHNMWISTNTAGTVGTPVATTTTIPMGIFGVSSVWTMLNDQYGAVGGTNTQVIFNFGSTASVGTSSLTFTLTNGTVISDAVDCLTGSCPAYATSLDTVDTYSPTGALDPVTGPNVSAFTVWGGTYNTAGALSVYANTTGNVYLDAQNFSLGSAYASLYLVNVQVVDTNTGANQSRDLLSAITVQATSTPEPSTWLLLASGLAIVGISVVRRRATN
jgi:hypothetical protein